MLLSSLPTFPVYTLHFYRENISFSFLFARRHYHRFLHLFPDRMVRQPPFTSPLCNLWCVDTEYVCMNIALYTMLYILILLEYVWIYRDNMHNAHTTRLCEPAPTIPPSYFCSWNWAHVFFPAETLQHWQQSCTHCLLRHSLHLLQHLPYAVLKMAKRHTLPLSLSCGCSQAPKCPSKWVTSPSWCMVIRGVYCAMWWTQALCTLLQQSLVTKPTNKKHRVLVPGIVIHVWFSATNGVSGRLLADNVHAVGLVMIRTSWPASLSRLVYAVGAYKSTAVYLVCDIPGYTGILIYMYTADCTRYVYSCTYNFERTSVTQVYWTVPGIFVSTHVTLYCRAGVIVVGSFFFLIVPFTFSQVAYGCRPLPPPRRAGILTSLVSISLRVLGTPAARRFASSCAVSIMLAMRQCAAWAFTLITQNIPERKKPRK